jgi:hypothetical protein
VSRSYPCVCCWCAPPNSPCHPSVASTLQCSWNNNETWSRKCDVHPLFIIAALTAPKPDDALRPALIRAAAADAACSVLSSAEDCNSGDNKPPCAWCDQSVRSKQQVLVAEASQLGGPEGGRAHG